VLGRRFNLTGRARTFASVWDFGETETAGSSNLQLLPERSSGLGCTVRSGSFDVAASPETTSRSRESDRRLSSQAVAKTKFLSAGIGVLREKNRPGEISWFRPPGQLAKRPPTALRLRRHRLGTLTPIEFETINMALRRRIRATNPPVN
jgi:hypothetical protein